MATDNRQPSAPRWPIDTFSELVDVLGPNAAVIVRGREVPLAQAEGFVPSYYFPVVSEADLECKLADLGLQPAEHDLSARAMDAGGEVEDAGAWS